MFILHLVYEVYVLCFFCLLFVMLIIHHGIWNLMVCLELMDPFFNMFNNSHSNKHDKYTNENNDHYYHSYCYFYFSILNSICWISIYERKNRQERILILINKLGKLEIMSSHFKCYILMDELLLTFRCWYLAICLELHGFSWLPFLESHFTFS